MSSQVQRTVFILSASVEQLLAVQARCNAKDIAAGGWPLAWHGHKCSYLAGPLAFSGVVKAFAQQLIAGPHPWSVMLASKVGAPAEVVVRHTAIRY